MHMRTRVRLASAIVAGLSLADCSAKPAGPGTLPPLTGSATVSAGAAATAPSATQSAGSSSPAPTDPSLSASATPTATGIAPASPLGSVTDMPVNDTSVDAAVKAATIAVGVFTRVAYTLDTSEVDQISTAQCPCRDTARVIRAAITGKHAHIVGGPVTGVHTKVIAKTPTAVRVQVTYRSPAHKELDAAGKVLQSIPSYEVTEVYQMNYVKDRWVVYFVEKP